MKDSTREAMELAQASLQSIVAPLVKAEREKLQRELMPHIDRALSALTALHNRLHGAEPTSHTTIPPASVPSVTVNGKTPAPARKVRKRRPTEASPVLIDAVAAIFHGVPEGTILKPTQIKVGRELKATRMTLGAACRTLAQQRVLETVGQQGYRLREARGNVQAATN